MADADIYEAKADQGARPFRYAMPEIDNPTTGIMLARTDHMMGTAMVFKEGAGEITLHSHPHMDGFYMVLGGRAKFYGKDDVLVADLGPHEGVLIPRGTPYWFESSSDKALELLLVEAFSKPLRKAAELMGDYVSHKPEKETPLEGGVLIDGRAGD